MEMTLPSTADSEVLKAQDLIVCFKNETVLQGLTLTVKTGHSAAIMGTTGSGKTTLLNTILGFIKPAAGNLTVCGTDMTHASSRQILHLRRHDVGMIFQSNELLGDLSPLENVLVPALLSGMPKTDAENRAASLLDSLKVPQRDTTSVLSGGEKQRVAIARALIAQPRLLIADEPTASLDSQTRDEVCDILFDLPTSIGCSLIVVTHDERVAHYARSRYRLNNGHLAPEGNGA